MSGSPHHLVGPEIHLSLLWRGTRNDPRLIHEVFSFLIQGQPWAMPQKWAWPAVVIVVVMRIGLIMSAASVFVLLVSLKLIDCTQASINGAKLIGRGNTFAGFWIAPKLLGANCSLSCWDLGASASTFSSYKFSSLGLIPSICLFPDMFPVHCTGRQVSWWSTPV